MRDMSGVTKQAQRQGSCFIPRPSRLHFMPLLTRPVKPEEKVYVLSGRAPAPLSANAL